MEDEWYYASEEGEKVSVSGENLKQLAFEKLITAQTLVWNTNLPNWQTCGTVHPEWFSITSDSTAPPKLPAHIKPVSGKPAHPLAIASLVCGLVALLPLGCLGILGVIFLPVAIGAIICGHLALKKIRQPDCGTDGRGVAIAGLVTGYLSLAGLALLPILTGFVLAIPMFIDPGDENTSPPADETREVSPPSQENDQG